MKRGLVGPPIEAPMLPEGYYWRIKRSTNDYDEPKFYVRIMRKRFPFSVRAAWGWGSVSEFGLRTACVLANEHLGRRLGRDNAYETYRGDWSGQA